MLQTVWSVHVAYGTTKGLQQTVCPVHVAYYTVKKNVQHPQYTYCDVLLLGFAITHNVFLRRCANKTKVMLNENATYTVAVDGNIVEKPDRYVYLGKLMTRVGNLLPGIKRAHCTRMRACITKNMLVEKWRWIRVTSHGSRQRDIATEEGSLEQLSVAERDKKLACVRVFLRACMHAYVHTQTHTHSRAHTHTRTQKTHIRHANNTPASH